MYSNLCPETVGIHYSSDDELLEMAEKAGFGGVDFPIRLISTIDQAKRARESIHELNLQWGLFFLPCDFLAVDDRTFEQGLANLEAALPVLSAAGCKRTYNHVWPGSNERDYDDNFAWHVDRLKKLIDRLGAYHIELGLEFIGPKTLRDSFRFPFIHNLSQLLELIDAVSPRLGVVLDTFHLYTSGGTPDQLEQLLADRLIVNVHVNDAFPGRAPEDQIDGERAMPLETGVIDLIGVLKALQRLGYDGPVICEPFQPTLSTFQHLPNWEVAHIVGHRMQELMAKL